MSESNSRPSFTLEEAAGLARQFYGRTGTLSPLPSYDDQNFRLVTPGGEQYVLKIAHSAEAVETLTMQNEAMAFAARRRPGSCPQPVTAVTGQTVVTDYRLPTTGHRSPYPLRLLTWLPGVPYARVRPHTAVLQRNLGQFIGQLDKTLAAFTHPAARRHSVWDLAQAARIADYTQYIQDKAKRALVEQFLAEFVTAVRPQLPRLRQQIIHGDANNYNIIVRRSGTAGKPPDSSPAAPPSLAIIDFGDTLYTALVCEPAIAAAYALLGQPDPRQAAARVIAGYHQTNPLTEQERALLFNLIATRLCVSVAMSSYRQTVEPENKYISISAQPAWTALQKLAAGNGIR